MAVFVALVVERVSKSNFNILFFIQFLRSVLAQAAAWAARLEENTYRAFFINDFSWISIF